MRHLEQEWRALPTNKLAEVLADILGEIEDRRVVARAMTIELVERLGAPDVTGPWPYVAPRERAVNRTEIPTTRPIGPARGAKGAEKVSGKPRERRDHSPEFKAEVVAFADEHNVFQASRHFDVSDSVIRNWVLKRDDLAKRLPETRLPETSPSMREAKPETGARAGALSVAPQPRIKLPGGAIPAAKKLEILDYALSHTVPETADFYAVSQRHIYDWRASRAHLEREAGVAS